MVELLLQRFISDELLFSAQPFQSGKNLLEGQLPLFAPGRHAEYIGPSATYRYSPQSLELSEKKRQQQAYQSAGKELAAWTAAAGRAELDPAYLDESGLSANPASGYAWTRTGEHKAVFPQRHSRRFNTLGCLLHSELAWQGIRGRVDAQAVICFMSERIKRLRRRTILVLDNASMHNCKGLLTWQDKWRQRGLEFYFLPASESD